MPENVPILPRGELAPAFELPDRNGVRVTRSQFRGRRFLVLLFFAPDATPEPIVAGLAEESERLAWFEVEVLAVLPVASADLPLDDAPLRYLSDPDLTTIRRFTTLTEQRPQTAVVVLDRYGAVEQRWIEPDLPPTKEVIGILERLAHNCSG